MTETATEEEKETAQDVVDEVVPDTEEVQNEEQEAESKEEASSQEEKKEDYVPVSAHVAERKRRQEAEERLRLYEQQLLQQQQKQEPKQEQNSDDLITVGQQTQTLQEWKREILEESYMQQNPEIIERIKTELPEILKDPAKQWLRDSIAQAPNRLQRAAEVMQMFKSAKREASPPPNRQNTPKSPQSVAKTNKMSSAERLMSMSDEELEKWRLSRKKQVR